MDVKYFEMKTDNGTTVIVWQSMKLQIKGVDGSIIAELDPESSGALLGWAAMFFNGAINSAAKEGQKEFNSKSFLV